MSVKRIIGLVIVYTTTCIAWLILAGVTSERGSAQSTRLREQVSSLWGEPQTQSAPAISFRSVIPATIEASGSELASESEALALGLEFPPPPRPETGKGAPSATPKELPASPPNRWVLRQEAVPVALSSSEVTSDLHYDPRRKGLVWYSLYDVRFTGQYTYEHTRQEAGYLDIELALPTQSALYDQLVFEVNGEDRRAALDPASGVFRLSIAVVPQTLVKFRAAYLSRGSDTWRYLPGSGVQQLERFHLQLHTDFAAIDFPAQTIAPTTKRQTDEGWHLNWDLQSTVTGRGIGMVLPEPIQPGQLSTALTLSAPVSLLFFFILLFVLATLRKLEIHPINYLFLGAAFFAFHLLFSYSADHLTVPWAFAASSVVSLILVVSYLRLVISPQFALREAMLGQLVYLIGFSLAHFWEGYTGLTITVLAIITLFLLMQVTGRLRWAEVLSPPRKVTAPPPGEVAAAS